MSNVVSINSIDDNLEIELSDIDLLEVLSSKAILDHKELFEKNVIEHAKSKLKFHAGMY